MDDRILLPPPPVEVRGDTVTYVGLGIGALGLVLTVVGLGEKVTRLKWKMDWKAVRECQRVLFTFIFRVSKQWNCNWWGHQSFSLEF